MIPTRKFNIITTMVRVSANSSSTMSLTKKKKSLLVIKVILIALFVLLQIYFIFIRTYPTLDVEVYPNTNPSPSLVGKMKLGQTFVATRNGLSRIEVMMGTYGRVNTREVEFSLWELRPQKKLLRKVTFNASAVKNNLFNTFSFSPIRYSKSREFYFQFTSPSSTPEDSICVWLNMQNIYPKGKFFYNEQRPNQQADIVFRAYAQRPIMGELGTIVQNNEGLMGKLWLLVGVLVLFEVIQIALFIILLNWFFSYLVKKPVAQRVE